MKSDKLLDAMGNLNDEILLDAKKGRSPSSAVQKRIIAAAAVFLILVVAGVAGKRVVGIISAEPTAVTEASGVTVDKEKVFIAPAGALKFGYVSCYTNPQGIADEESEDNLYGVADAKGDIILEPNYKEAYPINESVFAVKLEKGEKILATIVDKTGKELITAFDGEVEPLFENNGKAVAVLRYAKGGCVLVNETGGKIIDKSFDNVYATDFNQNILQAFDENNAYFISNEGKIIVTLPKNEIVADPFSVQPESETVVISACYAPESYGQSIVFGIYDKTAKREIVSCSRSYGYAINSNRFVLEDIDWLGLDIDGFAAIYDEKGNVVCASGVYQEIVFTYGASHGTGVCLIDNNGETSLKYWSIDADGNKISEISG